MLFVQRGRVGAVFTLAQSLPQPSRRAVPSFPLGDIPDLVAQRCGNFQSSTRGRGGREGTSAVPRGERRAAGEASGGRGVSTAVVRFRHGPCRQELGLRVTPAPAAACLA